MKEELIKGLYEPFELKEREGLGGMTFKYVPSNDIIDRMNKLFEGCWSTEVTSQERMDDFVVVRVAVTAYDQATDKWFSHAGYGSSSIMRYSGGTKAGQIIDLGNAYKSAESKAIKNACSRWGVGLYLEETPEDEGGPFNKAPTGGGGSPSSKTNQSTSTNMIPPPFPENNDKASIPASMPSMPGMPPVTTKTEPPKAVETPPTPPVQTTTSITQEADGPAKITDVQKVAIQGLLQIKASLFADVPENKRFEKLVTDALGRTDDLPGSPEGLSYQDAVTVIKYGNDIDKK